MRYFDKGLRQYINQCDHCDMPPITHIESKAGLVDLCMEHTLEFAGGKDVEWFESNHRPFSDHITEKIWDSQEKATPSWKRPPIRGRRD